MIALEMKGKSDRREFSDHNSKINFKEVIMNKY